MRKGRLTQALAAAFIACGMLDAAAIAASAPPLDGTQILARAGGAHDFVSYTVPVDFRVKTHSIIGTTHVAGTVYFKAPEQAALVITKAPPIIGGFFRGTYNIDLVPQSWPPKYRVRSVSRDVQSGAAVYVLHAVPANGGDVDSVLFTVTAAACAPVAATWLYHDGSRIDLTFADRLVQGDQLPAAATIAVNMPKYKIEASATYGTYAFNVPIDDAVFAVTNGR